MKKNNETIVPIILAGGAGERLWPLSRASFPKQFHTLGGKLSLLQNTLLRLNKINIQKPIIICNKSHKFIVKDQLSQINMDCDIFLEPMSKNTTASITLAALSLNLETNLLILPADHLFNDEDLFRKQVQSSLTFLDKKNIIIFGIKPTNPNINYGYIEAVKTKNEYFKVKSFKEKPNRQEAENYFKKEDFYWNSGIFMFKPTIFIEELKKYSPDILNVGIEVLKTAKNDQDFKIFDDSKFSNFRNISIDYAIMEYTKNSIMFPLDCEWSDLGSWSSVLEATNKNKQGNSLLGNDVPQTQDSIENFCNKISSAKATQITSDFMIIARIESLILEAGMEDAIERARAYLEAGADGIMIHSRQKSPDEVLEFCKRYNELPNRKPLVAVPSSYNQITEDELQEAGVNIVIYANHLLRSAYPAMLSTAKSILENKRSAECDKDLLSIKEMLELIPGTKL